MDHPLLTVMLGFLPALSPCWSSQRELVRIRAEATLAMMREKMPGMDSAWLSVKAAACRCSAISPFHRETCVANSRQAQAPIPYRSVRAHRAATLPRVGENVPAIYRASETTRCGLTLQQRRNSGIASQPILHHRHGHGNINLPTAFAFRVLPSAFILRRDCGFRFFRC